MYQRGHCRPRHRGRGRQRSAADRRRSGGWDRASGPASSCTRGGIQPGRGVPYRTADRAHRMNVPASRLSVDPDDPGHLLRWLLREGQPAAPDDYIERGLYGRYLEHVLSGRGRRAPQVEVEVVRATVIRIDPVRRWVRGHQLRWRPAGGTTRRPGGRRARCTVPAADRPPARGRPFSRRGSVGAGRTRRPGGRAMARRRHRPHHGRCRPHDPPPARDDRRRGRGMGSCPGSIPPRAGVPCTRSTCRPGPLTAASVRRSLVDHAASEPHGWPASGGPVPRRGRGASGPACPSRSRPSCSGGSGRGTCTATAWPPRSPTGSTPSSPAGSPAHPRRAHQIDRAGRRSAGGVRVAARAGDAAAGRPACGVRGRHRATSAATTDPLLRHLLDTGQAAVGPHRLGFAVDACGTVLDGSGWPVGGLSVLGALRKGTAFETTAIPELREQATACWLVRSSLRRRPPERLSRV